MHRKYLFVVLLGIITCFQSTFQVVLAQTTTETPELSGVRVSTERGEGISSSVIDLDDFASRVPSSWLAQNARNARYEINIQSSEGGRKRCEGYNFYLTVTFKQALVRVTVTDLTTNEVITSRTFRGNLPTSCPRTYTFRTINGAAVPASEWRTPNTSQFRSWLDQTISLLPSMPPTPTPEPTHTPTLTLTPSPTVPTSTPTSTPSLTPVPTIVLALTPMPEGSAIEIDGLVVIRDAFNNVVAHVNQGEYPLLGLVEDNYVILYDGAEVFVRTDSKSARVLDPSELVSTPTPTILPPTPSIELTLTPVPEGNILKVDGLVIIRDAFNNVIANVNEGEYPLLGVVDGRYVILFEGERAFVSVDSRNARVSTD